MSNLFKLNPRDFIKGISVAILAAILTSLSAALNLPGFSFGAFDWSQLLKIAIITGISYLVKNFISDSDGKILGSI